jgi:two-component system nitrogen regulation sensor histidine kinase NtrY
MASKIGGVGAFTLGVSTRAAAIGGLTWGVIELLATSQLYATALVLAAVAAVVALDLARAVGRADRELGRFVDALAAESFDRPAQGVAGFRLMAEAVDGATAKLAGARAERQQRIGYLETLADSVAAALLVLGPEGDVAAANRSAQRLIGEAVSRLADVAVIGPAAAEMLTGLPAGGRAIIRLEDGRQMLALAAVFRTPGAAPRRLISLQDIALELDAVELKAWQDLVRILAHEMMNSLTPIASLAESLQARLGGDGRPEQRAEAEAAAAVIARRSLGLMSFVDGYRKVAEIPRPVLKTVALKDFAAGVERLMGPALAAREVAFSREVTPQDLTGRFDADLLEQAVINLIGNAIDAVAGAAAAAVSLTCGRSGGSVTIAVSDNGPGISPGVRDNLFVPFFTTKVGGSGIGLSIARQIALAHQGQLEARDGVGGGASFVITLPLAD